MNFLIKLVVTYSTIKLPNPSNCPKYAKPLLFILHPLCLNHLTRYYLNIKGDFSLPSKPINLANSKATRLLIRKKFTSI